MLARIASAGAAAYVARRTYDAMAASSSDRWQRTNHRGEAVTLAEGPAVAAGSVVGLLLARRVARSTKAGALVGVLAASSLGAVDDLTGATDVKGLRGHLGELAQGRVTTGTVKLFGLAASGLVAGALSRRGRGGVVDAALAGGVVAGSANLANLLDLRPGRTAKVFLFASALPLAGASSSFGSVVAAPAGAVGILLPSELAEQCMLGDTGANALGAAWGTGAAASMSRRSLAATFAVLSVLTVLSEKVSFSRLIDATPVLRRLDALGRPAP